MKNNLPLDFTHPSNQGLPLPKEEGVRLWILGAEDPEMLRIENLLRNAGEKVAHATVAGVRVHPGNAYQADPAPSFGADVTSMTLIECGFAAGWEPAVPVVRVDHHRPGDPGYGRGPKEFLPASSVGQVIAHLAQLNRLPTWSAGTRLEAPRKGDFNYDKGWQVEDGDIGAFVPQEFVFAAAADHCLEAAYRSRCPGVDPDELMRWRAEARAAHQGRSVADVMEDIEGARRALREAIRGFSAMDCGHEDHPEAGCPGCGLGTQDPYADFRDRHVPELPEAACREGIPYLSTVTDRDGRKKVVLGAAPPELVTRFLAGEIVLGLSGMYGDPARGFAGGYLP